MNPPTEQLVRALAADYVVERELGVGGMATVFLARDIRHERQVAIKVLRDDVSQRMGAERFLREIRTTATLHHPHIVPLYDSGEVNGIVYYVMPFIEGETLRDRLHRERQLAVADAVRIATDIASALDYAHRHGFVHRDVKPENILLHENRALVADFGIALAVEQSGRNLRLTESGMNIGTPQYMSPEQAMGEKHITARTDIFALGSILYEMLAGEPPFTGETAQAIVAKMMTMTPTPVRDLRPTVPEHVAAAVDSALHKVAADRFATAAAFAEALENPNATTRGSSANVTKAASPTRRPWLAIAAALIIVAAAFGGAVLARVLAPQRDTTLTVARAVIPLARDQLLRIQNYPLNISDDGRYLAYVGDDSGKARLFLRPLADSTAQLVPGSDGASTPFFSPDGAWIGFFADGKLKKVPRTGGAPSVVTDAASAEAGAWWGSDGTILFAFGDSTLRRVRSDGAAAVAIVAEQANPARRHALGRLKWPAFLPGNERALVTTDSGVGVMELKSGAVRIVLRGQQARYLPTGQLLYDDNEGRVRVVGFDVRRGDVTGTSVPVFEAFRGPGGGAVYFAVSNNGTLVYVQGSFQRSLVRVDRNGRETPINVEPRGYRFPAVSPDGKSLAVTVDPRPSAIWLVDLVGEHAVPLTTDQVHSIAPVWSPDGTRIAFHRSSKSGGRMVWITTQAGSAPQQILSPHSDGRVGDISLSAWTRSAGLFGFQRNAHAGQLHADVVHFEMGDSTVRPIVTSPEEDRQATLSPDGKWLAYTSNISGANEVYVRPYPEDGASVLVSARGGVEPRWTSSGSELLFRSGSRIMSATVRTRPTFSVVGAPRLLFSGPFDFSQDANWSPSVDGSFIMVKADPSMGRQLLVVFNWFEELKARESKNSGRPLRP